MSPVHSARAAQTPELFFGRCWVPRPNLCTTVTCTRLPCVRSKGKGQVDLFLEKCKKEGKYFLLVFTDIIDS